MAVKSFSALTVVCGGVTTVTLHAIVIAIKLAASVPNILFNMCLSPLLTVVIQ
jgi:hypothetical protein